MILFLSNLCDDDEARENSSYDPGDELERYQKEKPLSAEDNPLDWWRKNKSIYPLMAQ